MSKHHNVRTLTPLGKAMKLDMLKMKSTLRHFGLAPRICNGITVTSRLPQRRYVHFYKQDKSYLFSGLRAPGFRLATLGLTPWRMVSVISRRAIREAPSTRSEKTNRRRCGGGRRSNNVWLMNRDTICEEEGETHKVFGLVLFPKKVDKQTNELKNGTNKQTLDVVAILLNQDVFEKIFMRKRQKLWVSEFPSHVILGHERMREDLARNVIQWTIFGRVLILRTR